MAYFRIGGTDFSHLVSGMKVGFETLVSDKSGRNAAGYTVVDPIATKRKVYLTLRHTTAEEMEAFMEAIKDYVVFITFLNPQTQVLTTIECYTGTPEPEYYTISDRTIFKPMSLNFIEL
jgi:hypothetical protein